MSDKELKKAIDSIQPGSCFGHHDKTVRECKTCFVVEQCSKNTASRKLADESKVPAEKPKKKKTTTSVKKKYVKRKEDIKSDEAEVKKEVVKAEVKKEVVKAEVKKNVEKKPKVNKEVESTGNSLVDNIIEDVGKSVPISGCASTAKSIFYLFDEKKMVVAYTRGSGNLQLSKNGEKKVYANLQNEEDAKILKEAMLVGYED